MQQQYTVVDAITPEIINECKSVDDLNDHAIIQEYYSIHNNTFDPSKRKEYTDIYIKAKQIIMYYSFPTMQYTQYMNMLFRKLRTIDKPNDPLHTLMEQYLKGELIMFQKIFEIMSIEEMNYLGD